MCHHLPCSPTQPASWHNYWNALAISTAVPNVPRNSITNTKAVSYNIQHTNKTIYLAVGKKRSKAQVMTMSRSLKNFPLTNLASQRKIRQTSKDNVVISKRQSHLAFSFSSVELSKITNWQCSVHNSKWLKKYPNKNEPVSHKMWSRHLTARAFNK